MKSKLRGAHHFSRIRFSSSGRWIWSRASTSCNHGFRQQDIAYRRRHLSAGQVSQGTPYQNKRKSCCLGNLPVRR